MELDIDLLKPQERAALALRVLYEKAGYRKYHMEDAEYFGRCCALILENRAFTVEALEKLGFTVLPSAANFVFARSGAVSGGALYKMLKARGVLVRHFDAPRISDYCRITIGSMAESGPDILGHIDLITKFNSGGAFLDEADPRYKKAALAALHAAHPEKTLLEINTGAISRGYRETPYPALFLLKEWRVLGGELIITSDSHSADTVVFGYAGAIELARAAGYDRAFTLTREGRLELPFDP